ncbi:hypothetical protein ABGT15_09820 [Flavobacterium enshiense]|uniref:hypothetical protein n=1 Tax=Flavobacterium enshiense TaxID=1341165 RepID=UPI00345CEC71
MKNLLLFLLFTLLLSCQPEETETVTYELLPVTEVTMPASFKVNRTANIQVKFTRPTGCHAFNKFYSEKEATSNKVAVESVIFENAGKECPAINGNATVTNNYKFTPDAIGPYTLQFWNGKDANGEDVFLTYEIDVTDQ